MGLAPSDPVHFVPMASVRQEFGGIDVSTVRPLQEVVKGYTVFRSDDVIFAKITPCMENGKLAVVPQLEHQWGFGSTEFHVLRSNKAIRNQWLAHFLSQIEKRREAQRAMTGSAGQLRVPVSWLAEQNIPIPPLGEQDRIVAKIEELFSELDAGVAALERVRAGLKRYRAAVLKAAVEGKLTEDWRAQHPDTEPASVLLERILTDRRHKWEEAQLAKFAQAGKQPQKGWQKYYNAPIEPDLSDDPSLPEGWCVASIEQISSTITSGSRDWSKYYGRGSGTFLMAQNVRMGKLDLSFRQAVDPPEDNRDRVRSQVEKGDILITIVGANTGEVCRIPSSLPEHYVCQSVALVRPSLAEVATFVEAYLISHDNGQRQFRRYIYGAGRPHLSFDQIKMTAVLLPPLEEQAVIVTEVERHLSIVDEIKAQVEANLKRAARLRQGILKRAFEGKLVPQDPTDEPAEKLLARIRQGRPSSSALKNGKPATRRRGRPHKAGPALPLFTEDDDASEGGES